MIKLKTDQIYISKLNYFTILLSDLCILKILMFLKNAIFNSNNKKISLERNIKIHKQQIYIKIMIDFLENYLILV